MSDLTLLHETHIKVPRLDMCRSISLSKRTHQMWHDHPFSQRNKSTEGTVGVRFGGDREKGGGGEGGKLEKGGSS